MNPPHDNRANATQPPSRGHVSLLIARADDLARTPVGRAIATMPAATTTGDRGLLDIINAVADAPNYDTPSAAISVPPPSRWRRSSATMTISRPLRLLCALLAPLVLALACGPSDVGAPTDNVGAAPDNVVAVNVSSSAVEPPVLSRDSEKPIPRWPVHEWTDYAAFVAGVVQPAKWSEEFSVPQPLGSINNDGVATLRLRTDDMNDRLRLLSNHVGLADQFVRPFFTERWTHSVALGPAGDTVLIEADSSIYVASIRARTPPKLVTTLEHPLVGSHALSNAFLVVSDDHLILIDTAGRLVARERLPFNVPDQFRSDVERYGRKCVIYDGVWLDELVDTVIEVTATDDYTVALLDSAVCGTCCLARLSAQGIEFGPLYQGAVYDESARTLVHAVRGAAYVYKVDEATLLVRFRGSLSLGLSWKHPWGSVPHPDPFAYFGRARIPLHDKVLFADSSIVTTQVCHVDVYNDWDRLKQSPVTRYWRVTQSADGLAAEPIIGSELQLHGKLIAVSPNGELALVLRNDELVQLDIAYHPPDER